MIFFSEFFIPGFQQPDRVKKNLIFFGLTFHFPISCSEFRLIMAVSKCSKHQYLFEATRSSIRRENQMKNIKDKKKEIFT